MSDSRLFTLRDMVKQLMDDRRPGWQRPAWEDTVADWFDREPRMLTELRDVGRPDSCRPTRDQILLNGLYALDRLTDLMILPWAPLSDGVSRMDRGQTQAAWLDLLQLIGAVLIAEDDYHPYFHEIVEVLPDDDPDAEPVLLQEHWPGALVGSLLLKRAGVTVLAGAHRIDSPVAATSTLYWAWQCQGRSTMDLSVGWGSGSQWGHQLPPRLRPGRRTALQRRRRPPPRRTPNPWRPAGGARTAPLPARPAHRPWQQRVALGRHPRRAQDLTRTPSSHDHDPGIDGHRRASRRRAPRPEDAARTAGGAGQCLVELPSDVAIRTWNDVHVRVPDGGGALPGLLRELDARRM